MKVKYNDNYDDLFCCFCKERINIGDKYVRIQETYQGEKYSKDFHPECLPEMEDDE